jgi:undecaprenyl-diphosphatase
VAALLDDIERVDAAIYAAVAATPTPVLDTFMARLSQAANYSRLSLAAAGLLAVTKGSRGRSAAAYGLASIGATATVANIVVKPLTRRERPERELHEVPASRHVKMPVTRSFPSGHTAAAFAFATGVAHTMPGAAVPLHGLAALVGYSRVHTGVHFPGDVVAGALLGTILAHVTNNAIDRRRTAG